MADRFLEAVFRVLHNFQASSVGLKHVTFAVKFLAVPNLELVEEDGDDEDSSFSCLVAADPVCLSA